MNRSVIITSRSEKANSSCKLCMYSTLVILAFC